MQSRGSSANWLELDEFLPYAPDVPGEQVQIHHCKPGNQNDRLFIRRNDDESVVGYCHHCGARGYYRSLPRGKESRTRRSERKSVDSGVGGAPEVLSLPKDFTTDVSRWHPRARAWVRKYGITDDELRANSVGFSERLGAVVFPVFGEEGALLAYQYRPIVREIGGKVSDGKDSEGDRETPKYITRRQKDRAGGVDLFVARTCRNSGADNPERSVCTRVVLTEDVLSAIKVSRVPRNVGAALMGSSLKEQQAAKAAEIGRDAAVFLDNDNEQVRRNQRKARKLLEPLVRGSVTVIEQDRDPKAITTSDLRRILEYGGDTEQQCGGKEDDE